MKFIKNLVLLLALSFAIASNAFANTVSTPKNSYVQTFSEQSWKNAQNAGTSKNVSKKKAAKKKGSKKKGSKKKGSLNNVPVNNSPVNNTPVNNTPVNNTPVNNTPVNNTPVNNTPVNNTPVNNTPENNLPEIDDQVTELVSTETPIFTPFEATEEVDSPDLGDSDLLKWTALDVKLDIDSQDMNNFRAFSFNEPSSVPVPAAAWLLGSALIGFVSFNKRRKI
jgi:hypothetical protein